MNGSAENDESLEVSQQTSLSSHSRSTRERRRSKHGKAKKRTKEKQILELLREKDRRLYQGFNERYDSLQNYDMLLLPPFEIEQIERTYRKMRQNALTSKSEECAAPKLAVNHSHVAQAERSFSHRSWDDAWSSTNGVNAMLDEKRIRAILSATARANASAIEAESSEDGDQESTTTNCSSTTVSALSPITEETFSSSETSPFNVGDESQSLTIGSSASISDLESPTLGLDCTLRSIDDDWHLPTFDDPQVAPKTTESTGFWSNELADNARQLLSRAETLADTIGRDGATNGESQSAESLGFLH